jgi:aspartyl-tRNA(Asn)/glutamyl-tRNA(Gln) amidotransferase subunit B
LLKTTETDITQSKVPARELAGLQQLVETGKINMATAKIVLEEMFNTGLAATAIVEQRGLGQISDEDSLVSAIEQVVNDHPQAVQDYREGRLQALGFLKGQIMRATRGKANPTILDELLVQRLK